MEEIGGYFGLEQLPSNEYYKDLIAVNNARNGLVYLIKSRQIKKIYLPHFLCDSVRKVCERENVEYELYHITNDLLPNFNKPLYSGEYLYVVNYYGLINNTKLLELKKRFGNIIADNVHAFFQKPADGIDAVYSCRKFFGVPDGGYVHTDAPRLELTEDKSKDRMKHLLGRFENKCASEYYADFKANDKSFGDVPLRAMSGITHNILGAIDYTSVKRKREENYATLAHLLGNENGIRLIAPEGPYAYPFYCANGMELKKRLAERKIYVPTLWPNVLEMQCCVEKNLAENILPLPCDQRYDEENMKFIAKSVLGMLL